MHNFCPLELYIRTQITITKQPDKLSGSYSEIWVMIIEKNFGNLKIELRPLGLTTRRSKTWRSRFSGLSRQFLTLKMSDHESKSKKIEVVPDGGQQELYFDVYIIWVITTWISGWNLKGGRKYARGCVEIENFFWPSLFAPVALVVTKSMKLHKIKVITL